MHPDPSESPHASGPADPQLADRVQDAIVERARW